MGSWKFWQTNRQEQDTAVVEVEPTTKSTARIQMALMVEMLRMLQEYEQSTHLPAMPQVPAKPANLIALEQLGFTNTEQWKDYNVQMARFQEQMESRTKAEEYLRHARNAIEVMKRARVQFGRDTLLIRFDDFERLMDKYNLVCGTFDRYIGNVPIDKMADISTLLNNTRGWYKPDYINTLRAVESCEIFSSDVVHVPDYINRFPFVKDHWGIETKDFHGNSTWSISRGYHLVMKKGSTELFICAPSKDMKKLESIRVLRNYNDPFICAHTDYGILVFTRWGEEADDAIIQKYEQANQILEGLSLS
jgi:hypothetical protein